MLAVESLEQPARTPCRLAQRLIVRGDADYTVGVVGKRASYLRQLRRSFCQLRTSYGRLRKRTIENPGGNFRQRNQFTGLSFG